MKNIFLNCAALALVSVLPGAAPAAVPDEDPTETVLSTEAVKGEEGAEDEDAQAEIQESDEDLVGYVEDYIQKDIILKGSFLLEDLPAKKVLKLSVDSVSRTVENGQDNSKIVRAVFKDAGAKKYNVRFHLHSAGFSDVDIFKIELKKEEKPKTPLKENKPAAGPKK